MKTISTYTHGVLDYIAGIILILAPNLFSFADLNGPPVTVARVFGVIFVVQALFTNYELGIFRILPLRLHLFNDYVLSAILAASPWIFGFYVQPANIWLPHLVIGCVYFVITAMTRTTSRLMHIEPEPEV
ncbi:MAG TPA: hypothetical protein VG754_04375 [Verrucomicrobiae bacterium]|nr:hypothetical protein [Verrucomicrobiae bacterium]